MKRRIWTVATTFSLAGLGAASPVWAKGSVTVKEPTEDEANGGDDAKDPDAKEPAGETSGKPVQNPKSPNVGPRDKDNPQAKAAGDHVAMPPKMEGKGQATANEDHTVEHGDTLWDLSQKYLGNPWYWPKVWSYNPQIANPHWIYPGDQVKFYPGAQGDNEAPAQVQEGDVKPPEEEAGDMEEEDQPMVSGGTYKVSHAARSSFRQDGFVTERELEESGQIFKSDAEKEMLDNLDRTYMRFKSTGDVKPGDRFFIYTTEREIHHPVTGAKFGYLTRIVGTLRVIRIADNQVVEGSIDQTWGEIYRGYYLAPYSEKLYRQVPVKAATADIKGVVVESDAALGNIAAWDVVFIDKGKRDGVEEGTAFNVVRRVDGAAGMLKEPGESGFYDANLPDQIVGSLYAVDVKDDASTCLGLRSTHEFVPGDVIISVKNLGNKVSSL